MGIFRCRWIVALVLAAACALSSVGQASAASDEEIAQHIATLLGREFSPDSVSVAVHESTAYAEMYGAVLSKMRIDQMRLEAVLVNKDAPLSDDVRSLSSLIGYSRGEITLLESDVNSYFDGHDTSGFSKLNFDFTPQGFRASGIFSAQLLFTINIRLAATGVLALRSDGVYLDKVKIYAENVPTPDMLTDQVLHRVNPLIDWDRIPFKVEFKEVTMDDDKAVMTGYPERKISVEPYIWTRENEIE